MTPAPRNISQEDARTLCIEWSDGRRCQYDVRELRLACPCAGCVHEWTGKKILQESSVAQDVHPMNLESVGLYGIRIQWSDGHDTGIYSYDHLLSLCETNASDD